MIINDDCFKVLKTIEDKSIDHIITDPPYFINYLNSYWDIPETEKFEEFFYTLGKEFQRITKDNSNIIIFSGWSNVCKVIEQMQLFFTLKNWIIYDRIKGRGATKNLMSTREDILWFTKSDKYAFNKIYSNIKKKTKGMGEKNGQENRSLSNIWYDISPLVPWSKEKTKHPTQKPLSLMERIVTIFTNIGDTVLDPFAGSGTTLVACKNLERGYIGIEKDESYFNIIKERL